MPASAARTKEPTQQDVCIDLPGETVQCWRSSDNLKVVLRKHRDVIFDLNLGKGKTYTVHATESDFYNARDKQLVYARRRGVVSFKDGERLHLWVTRSFKGSLVLSGGSEILMKLTPNELDKHQYDDTAKTKPAPIIVALGSSKPSEIARAGTRAKLPSPAMMARTPSAAPVDEQCSLICVVEATAVSASASIDNFFRKGGGKSLVQDIDPFDVATRNWLLGQLAGAAAYTKDNWNWLRASLDNRTHHGFKLVSAKIRYVRGRARIYFSGYSRYNSVFGPGGFGSAHERVVNIFAGVGKTSSTFTAVAKGVRGTFKGNAFTSFIFSTAAAIAEWHEDNLKDGYDISAALLMTVLKTIISAALAVAIVAMVIFLAMALAGAALPVLVVGTTTIVAGFFASYIVDASDKTIAQAVALPHEKSNGLADALAPALHKAHETIQRNWGVLMRKFPLDYSEMKF